MTGIDIIQISRIKMTDALVRKILTADEQQQFDQFAEEKRKKEYLAGRFCAKEAIFKATQDRNYLSYSILNEKNGRPYVVGHPEISVSISHDGDYAVAIALVKQP